MIAALPEVIDAVYRGGCHIQVKFNDGIDATLDFQQWLHGPVFEPLKDLDYFRRFYVADDTVVWPNGADVAPDTLYEAAKDTKRTD